MWLYWTCFTRKWLDMYIATMSATEKMILFVHKHTIAHRLKSQFIKWWHRCYQFNFLAAIGGLLGLGFGFSFISAMELIYFFSIRMYFTNKDESKNVIYPENSINSPIIPGGEKIISANNVTKRGKITNTSLRHSIASRKNANIPLK